MIPEGIRELQAATPFEPYTVHTSDGKALYVKHPDYCFISPAQDRVYIFTDEIHKEIVATGNITRVVPGARRPRSRRRQGFHLRRHHLFFRAGFDADSLRRS